MTTFQGERRTHFPHRPLQVKIFGVIWWKGVCAAEDLVEATALGRQHSSLRWTAGAVMPFPECYHYSQGLSFFCGGSHYSPGEDYLGPETIMGKPFRSFLATVFVLDVFKQCLCKFIGIPESNNFQLTYKPLSLFPKGNLDILLIHSCVANNYASWDQCDHSSNPRHTTKQPYQLDMS